MSPTEIVVDYSKRLEYILEHDFGAQGKGLHSKVSSVEHLLPEKLVKQLRFLASIRNKVIHDYNYVLDKNPRDLQRTANAVIAELTRLSKRKRTSSFKGKLLGLPWWLWFLIIAIGVYLLYTVKI
jgi:hypothetical protein